MNCLKCGSNLDGFTCTTGKALPKDGDVSVCIYCSHVAIYDDAASLTLREPTLEELAEIMNAHEVRDAIALTKIMRVLKER